MIDDNVGHALNLIVSGNGHYRNGQLVVPNRVYGDDGIHSPVKKRLRIFFDKVGTVTMARDKKEVVLFQKAILDSAEDGRGISFTDFRDNYANSEAAAQTQGARQQIRPIIELLRGLEYEVFGFFGDGVRGTRTI